MAFTLKFPLVFLAVTACAEPPVEHRERRGSAGKSSADAVSAAEASAELAGIVGYECPGRPIERAFGERTVRVDARSYWTSTGLYLSAGETATLTAAGTWTIWQGRTEPFDADGGAALSTVDGCKKGALVAKIGLSLDSEKICVGKAGEIVADRSGIVYLAMNDSASPAFHGGAVDVTVDSASNAAPSLTAADASDYDFCSLASGWAEIETEGGLLLTVPAALAASQQAEIPASLTKLDAIFGRAAELFGSRPFAGEALRFYPDFAVRRRGWIVAGNPLLYDPKNLNAATPSAMKMLDLDAEGSKLFDFARAIGVDVSRGKGGRYQADENLAEAFGGLIAAYVAEEIPLGPWPRDACTGAEAQGGTLAEFLADPWLQLCLLTELQKAHGWELFAAFFAGLPTDWTNVLPEKPTPLESWRWLQAELSAAAGQDLSATFARYRIVAP